MFHRWNSCKQNKQAANSRAATNNQMVTPEGEKLHSDSGISVDTQSLQEHQQAQADVQAPPPGQDQIGQCTPRCLQIYLLAGCSPICLVRKLKTSDVLRPLVVDTPQRHKN